MYICTYILIPLASLQDQSELPTDAVSTSVVVADAVEAGPKKTGWVGTLSPRPICKSAEL